MTDEDGAAGDRRRRWFIRLLIGLGIGIPVAIEGVSLLGLLQGSLLDGDGNGGTPTPNEGVAPGDELLPATPQADVLERAVIRVGDPRVFELTVRVENTGTRPYRLRVGPARTDAGTQLSSGTRTDRLSPGESTTLTGTWELPGGEDPEAVTLVGIVGTEPDRTRHERTVELSRVPVSSG